VTLSVWLTSIRFNCSWIENKTSFETHIVIKFSVLSSKIVGLFCYICRSYATSPKLFCPRKRLPASPRCSPGLYRFPFPVSVVMSLMSYVNVQTWIFLLTCKIQIFRLTYSLIPWALCNHTSLKSISVMSSLPRRGLYWVFCQQTRSWDLCSESCMVHLHRDILELIGICSNYNMQSWEIL
jgi:hypothetical protein